MPVVSLVGVNVAGGTITGQLQSRVYVDGRQVAVVGDAVAAHPPCPDVPVHCAPTMAEGSARVFIDGKAVVRAGDGATCGHVADGLASHVDA